MVEMLELDLTENTTACKSIKTENFRLLVRRQHIVINYLENKFITLMIKEQYFRSYKLVADDV